MSNKFVIAVYVDNKFGVLTRVTSMFTRRGFNIDALTVGETESPEYSRITICLSGDGYAKDQLINQLRKLYNVKKVEEIEERGSIKRELALIKVKNESEKRADILSAVEVYRAKVIDFTSSEMCIEITGDPSKINAFIEYMLPYGIIEMCRTGIVALERGSGTLLSKVDKTGVYKTKEN
ncbi:MAG: acetolactate synthase small subunit [Clostridia bacterium]|nr:acetolactate synthase small subunit [Clostridia bacterium]MBQ7788792.1 acetolactate synthase small subunit [Clostridia bacterium]